MVSPTTAALLVPYANRLGTDITEDTTDAMLMIEPEERFSMAGRNAVIVNIIERTLTVQLRSNSAGVHSSIAPLATYPTQLTSTETSGCFSAVAATADA